MARWSNWAHTMNWSLWVGVMQPWLTRGNAVNHLISQASR